LDFTLFIQTKQKFTFIIIPFLFPKRVKIRKKCSLPNLSLIPPPPIFPNWIFPLKCPKAAKAQQHTDSINPVVSIPVGNKPHNLVVAPGELCMLLMLIAGYASLNPPKLDSPKPNRMIIMEFSRSPKWDDKRTPIPHSGLKQSLGVILHTKSGMNV
jgi:hypothetical protein